MLNRSKQLRGNRDFSINRIDRETTEKGHIQRDLPILPIQKRDTIRRKTNTQRKIVSDPQIKNLTKGKIRLTIKTGLEKVKPIVNRPRIHPANHRIVVTIAMVRRTIRSQITLKKRTRRPRSLRYKKPLLQKPQRIVQEKKPSQARSYAV